MTKSKIVAGYALSNDGNVKRLIDTYGDIIRYCPEVNEWIVFENGEWQIDHRALKMMNFAGQTAASIQNVIKMAASQGDRDALERWAMTSGMFWRIKKMVRLAKQVQALIISFNALKSMATDYSSIEWREHTRYWQRKLNLPRNV